MNNFRITDEMYQDGLDFLTGLLAEQKARNDKLVPFTQRIINLTVLDMNQTDLFNVS